MSFFSEFAVEIVGVILISFVYFLLGFLPSKYQLHKRINYILKISKAVAKFEISIPYEEKLSKEDLEEIFESTFARSDIEVMKSDNILRLDSHKTGTSYELFSSHDPERDKNFILFKAHSPFRIDAVGNIYGLISTISEITEIMSFVTRRADKAKITVHILFTPRNNFLLNKKMKDHFFDSKVKVRYTLQNCDVTHNNLSVKVVNNGLAYLKQNISHAFYNWMSIHM